MVKSIERQNVVGGLFKVRDEAAKDVVAFVSGWKSGSDGAHFERLSVRDCTGKKERDQLVAIEFLFVFDEGDPDGDEYLRLHQAFFHKYTDLLHRRFGNGLAVWDISTPVYSIID